MNRILIAIFLSSTMAWAQQGNIFMGYNHNFGTVDSSFVLGSSQNINASYSVTLGRYLSNSGSAAFVIGTGISNTDPLLNNISNSLMVGFNSNYPTLTVTGGDGTAGSFGRIGIGSSNAAFLIDARSQGADDAPVFRLANGDASQYIEFFGGRSGDPNPFIGLAQNSPIRFATTDGTFNELVRFTPDTLVGIGTQFPAYTIDALGAIRSGGQGADGQLRIYSEQGATDYQYIINPNNSATQDVNLTLPADAGTFGQLLATDGGGNLIWSSPTGFTASNGLNIAGSDVRARWIISPKYLHRQSGLRTGNKRKSSRHCPKFQLA